MKKIAAALGLTAITFGLVCATSFKANALVDPGGGYFCKHDPAKDTGRCYVWSSGASCDSSANSNKDCWGTGQD